MSLQLDAPLLEVVHQLLGRGLGRRPRRGREDAEGLLAAFSPVHDTLDQNLPDNLVCCERRRRGARCNRRLCANEEFPDVVELRVESLQFRVLDLVCILLVVAAVGEPVRQDAPEQLGLLVWLGQEAQPDDSGQHQEELHIAILAHLRQRWRQLLRPADLGHEVAHRAEERLVLHVTCADLPTLLPIHQASDEARVVAEVRVHALREGLDVPQVVADGVEGPDDVAREQRGRSAVRAQLLRRQRRRQSCERTIENIAAEIVPTFTAAIGD
mmetsp:Transcript_41286/g.106744  ORF Transcript_41286/g.106744 Transcript_41286/m.106744 type:complete len:270 (+) Transcript_41286:331-1140(+)